MRASSSFYLLHVVSLYVDVGHFIILLKLLLSFAAKRNDFGTSSLEVQWFLNSFVGVANH